MVVPLLTKEDVCSIGLGGHHHYHPITNTKASIHTCIFGLEKKEKKSCEYLLLKLGLGGGCQHHYHPIIFTITIVINQDAQSAIVFSVYNCMFSEYLLLKLVSNFTIVVSAPYTFPTAAIYAL